LILVTAMRNHTQVLDADGADMTAAGAAEPVDGEKHEGRVARIAHTRSIGFGVATTRRFFAVDGLTHAGLLSIELFTTVIPLMIIGFSYFNGFSSSANLGDHFVELLGLTGERAQAVHDLFGSAQGIRSTWTVFGVAGFLVWGVPMAITVSAMYARAWGRPSFGIWGKLWRGGVWFLVYLGTTAVRGAALAGGHVGLARAGVGLVDVLVMWLFWSLTPVLLVRNGAHGLRALFIAGFAGVIIDGLILTAAARIALPILLGGWNGFGPIGVAMVMMTWCGVIGYGWVATACATAILWERTAPLDVVVKASTRNPFRKERWVHGAAEV
jgi:hypothetical protein